MDNDHSRMISFSSISELSLFVIDYKKSFDTKKPVIIGISGIPGSGKSTFVKEFKKALSEKSVIIPFDGFHKYKCELFPNLMIYRGRIDTFDLKKFKSKLDHLTILFNSCSRENSSYSLYFPSFDHSIGDPIENDIIITEGMEYILVEGLYIFLSEVDCIDYFNIKIFLTSNLDESMKRVAERNFEAGISKSMSESILRTDLNDRENASYILENLNSVFDNNIIIKFKYIN